MVLIFILFLYKIHLSVKKRHCKNLSIINSCFLNFLLLHKIADTSQHHFKELCWWSTDEFTRALNDGITNILIKSVDEDELV